jgi:glyoxylate reductase
MQKPPVFVTRRIPGPTLERLSEEVNIDLWEEEGPPPKEVIIQRSQGKKGIFTLLTDPIDAEVIEACKTTVKVISQMAVGYDNIDVNAASRAGIPVGNTPGVLTDATADFTWALLLAIGRRVVEADKLVRDGIWKPWGPEILLGAEINGSTLGIVGFGRIGQAVARRAAGFGMQIHYYDLSRHPEAEKDTNATYMEFDELLQTSDFITLHTSLTDKTYHLFDREAFKKMKKGIYLINASRGAIIDPQALVWALQNGIVAGAALDVFEPEPIPGNHVLLGMDKVIITPHIASASVQTRLKMAMIAVDNLLAGIKGSNLPYCVNPQVYDVR